MKKGYIDYINLYLYVFGHKLCNYFTTRKSSELETEKELLGNFLTDNSQDERVKVVISEMEWNENPKNSNFFSKKAIEAIESILDEVRLTMTNASMVK